MALTDINFQEGEGQDFLVEFPSVAYSGSVEDIAIEPEAPEAFLFEIPEKSGGGNIFIMSE
jgi:hypothetical protein